MSAKSKFIDHARIFVRAGSGGDGHVGFHRAKFIPKGGPSGGDGGRGGDIVFVGSNHVSTLQDFQYVRHFEAENGEKGGRDQCNGKKGKDKEIMVPLGTVILDEQNEKPLGELTQDNQRLVLEEGGRGGLGNVHFKSSTHQAPRVATPGEKREGKWVHLELRLLADVGIVGPPNAGKSTLLGALTNAKPKVGNYPFTTLNPTLGMLNLGDEKIALADVPGLIEGAKDGAGLGIQFLKHIARTRLLLYVIPIDNLDPKKAYEIFETTAHEIEGYDVELSSRPKLIALNKIDLIDEGDLKRFTDYFLKKKCKVIPISAIQNKNLEKLTRELKNTFEKRKTH